MQRALRRLCKLSLGDEWHWHCAVGYYRRDCASPLRLLANSIYRGIAVQILTFGLERRFGVSLKDILKHFPSAARPHTHVLPIRPLVVT